MPKLAHWNGCVVKREIFLPKLDCSWKGRAMRIMLFLSWLVFLWELLLHAAFILADQHPMQQKIGRIPTEEGREIECRMRKGRHEGQATKSQDEMSECDLMDSCIAVTSMPSSRSDALIVIRQPDVVQTVTTMTPAQSHFEGACSER